MTIDRPRIVRKLAVLTYSLMLYNRPSVRDWTDDVILARTWGETGCVCVCEWKVCGRARPKTKANHYFKPRSGVRGLTNALRGKCDKWRFWQGTAIMSLWRTAHAERVEVSGWSWRDSIAPDQRDGKTANIQPLKRGSVKGTGMVQRSCMIGPRTDPGFDPLMSDVERYGAGQMNKLLTNLLI